MKIKFLLVFVLIPFITFAQEIQPDSLKSSEKSWKFAAGVSLLSNINHTRQQEAQPIELNFRYNIKNKHTLRLGIPLTLNHKIFGEPEVSSGHTVGEMPALDYIKNMKDGDLYPFYNSFYKTLKNEYSLYGISVGYDYSYKLMENLSAFAGADLEFCHFSANAKYYNIHYINMSDNYMASMTSVIFINRNINSNAYMCRPLLGVRYQFQRLLIEGNLGYSFNKRKFYGDMTLDLGYQGGNNEIRKHKFGGYVYNEKQFNYNINISYIFK
ncbi:hypothetical protein [Bacteroides sedimenti]|uniref:DUF3575 domain-containing protein n=1 Tax=Bacteroides sedimenti TaxID=2136147 RepID=A0ABM8IDE0_9BACE